MGSPKETGAGFCGDKKEARLISEARVYVSCFVLGEGGGHIKEWNVYVKARPH